MRICEVFIFIVWSLIKISAICRDQKASCGRFCGNAVSWHARFGILAETSGNWPKNGTPQSKWSNSDALPNARAARALPRTFLLSLPVILESWPLAVQACAVRAVRSPFPFVPLARSTVHLLPRVPLPIPRTLRCSLRNSLSNIAFTWS